MSIINYMTIGEALAQGYTIDRSAAGRPWRYKGARFGPSADAGPLQTPEETALFSLCLKLMTDLYPEASKDEIAQRVVLAFNEKLGRLSQ